MLAGFVQETANNPGTSTTVNLAGAVTGRRSFYSAFGVSQFFYVIDDGNQAEWGYGTVTAGGVLSRTLVLGNTAGTAPSKLNFTGAVRVYNEFAAERALYRDAGGTANIPGALTVTGLSSFIGGALVTSSLTVTGTSLGRVKLIEGSSTKPGYISFHSADDTRRGYFGWSNSLTGGSERLLLQTENSWGMEIVVGSSKEFKLTASTITLLGTLGLTGSLSVTAGDISLVTIGSKFVLYNFAANNAAYILANLSTGSMEFWCGSGVTVAKRLDISSTTGAVDVTGSLNAASMTIAGSAVLHATIARTAVGAYTFAKNNSASIIVAGGSVAGSSLIPTDTGDSTGASALSGTWECMGYCDAGGISLFRRIA